MTELVTLCGQGSLEEVIAYRNKKPGWLAHFFTWSNSKDLQLWQQAAIASCGNRKHGLAILQYLQEQKLITIPQLDRDGNSLLHHAVANNHLVMTKYLIEMINPNIMNKSGKTIVDLLTSSPSSIDMIDFVCLHPLVQID